MEGIESVDMNILYLGYWNVDDPLTSATILPHLRLLKNLKSIESIVFTNTQRESVNSERIKEIERIGVVYKPLLSKNISPNLLNKINDFILFPKLIKEVIKKYNIQFIIARGSAAGGLAYLVWKNSRIQFAVESFEPHAEYMLASGTWKKFDPRYLYQTYLERQQKKYATALITVSDNYSNALKREGAVKGGIFTAPCAVDLEKFYPHESIKEEMRKNLNIPLNATVGLYAGKFGSLYYDKEAFGFFKEAFNIFDNFWLMILTSHDVAFIKNRFVEFNIPENKSIITFVPHDKMPQFLNAADFAFATIKNLSVSKYQSPVKVGEYMACGLPVILTNGVGDESDYLEQKGAGVLIKSFNKNDVEETYTKLKTLLKKNSATQSHKLAEEKRSISIVKKIYEEIF